MSTLDDVPPRSIVSVRGESAAAGELDSAMINASVATIDASIGGTTVRFRGTRSDDAGNSIAANNVNLVVLTFDHNALPRRQRYHPVLARLEPGIFGELLRPVGAGPLVIIEDDEAAGHDAME